MRLRRKTWARPELEKCDFVVTEPREFKGRWKEVFGNENPIYLELGCGFGSFLAKNAIKNPNINYIAIDLKDEVLVYAKRKVEETFEKENRDIHNVRLIPLEIAFIKEIFDKNEIDHIFINFCNPWPKERHHKRRLTHTRKLQSYKEFMKKDTEIWFKTDDKDLFEASLDYFKDNGFHLEFVTYDLHNSDFDRNIVTEYEEKFSKKGMKIMFLIGKLK